MDAVTEASAVDADRSAVDFVEHCRRELGTFEALLDGNLAAPIRRCGSWNLYRLADHLGRQNLWSAAAITEGRGDFDSPRAPQDRIGLTTWFRGTSETLLAALERDPDAPAWTIYPPETVGFWRRRRAHETQVHRWDAEDALGMTSTFDPELVADGIAEVLDTMLPRQLSFDRAVVPDGVVYLRAQGFATRWGAGTRSVTVRAEAPEQLLLLLWKRATLDGDAFVVDGDADLAREFFAAALVP